MKKVLFLMFLLFLTGLGTASVSAQVRIGGNAAPDAAAVLDLNADGTATGTKGLALPRVSLSSNTVVLPGATANLNGMLVYNTGGTITAGIYYWNGSQWVSVQTGMWRGVAECTGCHALAIGGRIQIPWSSLGAPAWANSSNCLPAGGRDSDRYSVSIGINMYVTKNQTTSREPNFFVLCWRP